MTKELELFKRWFGLDLGEYKLNLYISPYAKTFSVMFTETSNLPGYIINDAANTNCVSHLYIMKDEDYDVAGIGIVFDIPSQYHAEWEQHVKEKP